MGHKVICKVLHIPRNSCEHKCEIWVNLTGQIWKRDLVATKAVNSFLYPLQTGKEIMDLHCSWKLKQTLLMLKTDETGNTPGCEMLFKIRFDKILLVITQEYLSWPFIRRSLPAFSALWRVKDRGEIEISLDNESATGLLAFKGAEKTLPVCTHWVQIDGIP